MSTRPPADVLDAFGATAEPVLLEGGMGRTWRAGDVVLKPVEDVVEHAWVAEVYDAWSYGDRPGVIGRAAYFRPRDRALAWVEASDVAVGDEDGYSIGNEALLDQLEGRLA